MIRVISVVAAVVVLSLTSIGPVAAAPSDNQWAYTYPP